MYYKDYSNYPEGVTEWDIDNRFCPGEPTELEMYEMYNYYTSEAYKELQEEGRREEGRL